MLVLITVITPAGDYHDNLGRHDSTDSDNDQETHKIMVHRAVSKSRADTDKSQNRASWQDRPETLRVDAPTVLPQQRPA